MSVKTDIMMAQKIIDNGGVCKSGTDCTPCPAFWNKCTNFLDMNGPYNDKEYLAAKVALFQNYIKENSPNV